MDIFGLINWIRSQPAEELNLLPAPGVGVLLPDFEGGQPNLLPLSALSTPVRVDFDLWPNSHPDPGATETLELFWDDGALDSKTLPTPVNRADLYLDVPVQRLSEGEHRLCYTVTTRNHQTVPSEILTITIDRTAPVLVNDGVLIFAPEVITNGVTADWLAAHDDKLIAELPTYLTPAAGDLITLYWGSSPVGQDEVATHTLIRDDLGKPIQIEFAGDTIRQSGNGVRYAGYKIQDRAGNTSQRALAQELKVTALAPTLPAPGVPSLLPDGTQWDEIGLLPAADALKPLPVEVPAWDHQPVSGARTLLTLYWVTGASTHQAGYREWDASAHPPGEIPQAERLLDVQPVRLVEGSHEVWYHLTDPQGSSHDSLRTPVTIDLTAPQLGSNGGRLLFDTDTITEQYLIDNNDRLLAEVPIYTTMKPGDVITWYWSVDPNQVRPDDVVDSRTLQRGEIQPLSLVFTGAMILARGDGERYAFYRLRDRAGNETPNSSPVRLTVQAQPVGRELPAPRVAEATGSGSQSSLDPINARNGATVVIPPEAEFKPGDVIEVFWAAPGSEGAYQSRDAETPGRFKVPAEYVPAHMGKQIPVYYQVSGNGPDEESLRHTLSVQRVGSGWPTVQCTRPTINAGRLSLATVIGHAAFRVSAWLFMGAGQQITITLSASGTSRVVLDAHVVTAQDVTNRFIATDVVKSTLEQLPLGSLNVLVKVSFDGGSTVVNFPTLNLTLVA